MKIIASKNIGGIFCTLVLYNNVVYTIIDGDRVGNGEVVDSSNLEYDFLLECLLEGAYKKWKSGKLLEEISFE